MKNCARLLFLLKFFAKHKFSFRFLLGSFREWTKYFVVLLFIINDCEWLVNWDRMNYFFFILGKKMNISQLELILDLNEWRWKSALESCVQCTLLTIASEFQFQITVILVNSIKCHKKCCAKQNGNYYQQKQHVEIVFMALK